MWTVHTFLLHLQGSPLKDHYLCCCCGEGSLFSCSGITALQCPRGSLAGHKKRLEVSRSPASQECCLTGSMAPTVIMGKIRVKGTAISGAFASLTTLNGKEFPPGAVQGGLLTKAGLSLLSCGNLNKCFALTICGAIFPHFTSAKG